MGQRTTGGCGRTTLTAVRRCAGRCFLAALVGCRSPALPYVVEPSEAVPPRKVVLVRQLAADSAVELTHHPLRSGRALVAETADHLTALGHGEFGKRVVLPLRGQPGDLPDDPPPPLDLAALEASLQHLTGRDLQPASVQLYPDGAGALTVLEQLIAQATSQIDIIMFYWENDPLGLELVERLVAQAGPHVRVRVLIDGGGNLIFGLPSQASAAEVNGAVARLLHHPNIEVVRIRNPFARFDHRKLVLIDGKIAWTGGRNFDFQAFFAVHDLSFTLEGPLVAELQERFEDCWQDQGGAPHSGSAEARSCHNTNCPPASPADHCSDVPANATARLIHTDPGDPSLAKVVYRAVACARQHIYMANVYLNDSRLVVRLADARRRGVDVRVLLTFTTMSDTIARSNRVVANRLLQAGVRVFVYPGRVHIKAASVDGCWAYLGTGNFDALSFRHNREMAVAVSGGTLITELEERVFAADFRPEWELHEPLPLTWHDYFSELVASLAL
jgi:cardiolipin synthase